jgi:hypothetical protein
MEQFNIFLGDVSSGPKQPGGGYTQLLFHLSGYSPRVTLAQLRQRQPALHSTTETSAASTVETSVPCTALHS